MGYDTRSWETTTGNHLSKTKSSIRVSIVSALIVLLYPFCVMCRSLNNYFLLILQDYGSDHFKESVNPGTKSVNWNLGTDKTDYSTSNFQRKPEVCRRPT